MFKNSVSINIQLIGLLFFTFYAVLALIFFKERMLSFDSAAFVLELMQTKSFVTPHNRFGNMFAQILPLLYLKVGSSLTLFVKVYSLSFIVLYYLGFLIVTKLLKSNRMGIVYLLTFCLTTRNTFYFGMAELSIGMLLAVILYTMIAYFLLEENKRKKLMFFLSFVLVFCLYYFHQLMLIAIVFVVLLAYFKNEEYKNIKLLSLFGFTILWFGANIIMLPSDGYEANKMPGLDVFIQEIPNFLDLPSFKYFYHHFKTELLIPFLISLIAIYTLLIRKKFFLALLFIAYPLAYFIIIIITYHKGDSPNMYELYYLMFGLIIAFLVNTVKENKLSLRYINLIIVPILIYSSQRIYAAHHLPTKRVEFINLLSKHGKEIENRKYILHPGDFPWGYGWVTWAIPSEFLLISSLEDKKNGVVFYVPSANEIVDTSSNDGQLLSAPWQQHLLNTRVLDTAFFSMPSHTNYLLTNRLKRTKYYYQSQIRYNYEWREKEVEKAKKNKISLEEMIQIDAQYLTDNSEKKKLEKVLIKND